MMASRLRAPAPTHDITAQFRKAAAAVHPGTLVKDDHFSLFEAVGGIEIGDAKMDSGCLADGESPEEQYDLERHLQPEELIWLLDELTCGEVAWLMGHPLSQTLFTSVYVDRLLWPNPRTLADATFVRGIKMSSVPSTAQILRACCLCLIKSCDIILAMVTSQHYYEEEDFTTQLFNRDLLASFHAQDILSIVDAASLQVKTMFTDPAIAEAILTRLNFRRDILQFVVDNSQRIARSRDDERILRLLSMLEHLKSTPETFRKPVPDAFSMKIQRRLASSVPPRPMVTVEFEKAWTFWRQLVTDCANSFDVLVASSPDDMMTAYRQFAFQSPQLSAYPRSLLQSFLSIEDRIMGRWSAADFILEDLKSSTIPFTILLPFTGTSQLEVVALMQAFYAKFEQAFVNLYRALCLNQCRIRRTFCHGIIEWDRLQPEAEDLDTTIQNLLQEQPVPYPPGSDPAQSFSLGSWVYHHKLVVLRSTIQMGFEQNIYAPHELAGMYWYLSHVCDLHLGHLERISYFVSKADERIRGSAVPAANVDIAHLSKTALARLYREFCWVKATQSLAEALHCIFAILQRHGIWCHSKQVYSSPQLRHEIRMKPFMNLTIPDAPTYEEFSINGSLSLNSNENVIQKGKEAADAAKMSWQEVSKGSWNGSVVQHPSTPPRDVPHGRYSKGNVVGEKWRGDVGRVIKACDAARGLVAELSSLKMEGTNGEIMRLKARLPSAEDEIGWYGAWLVPILAKS